MNFRGFWRYGNIYNRDSETNYLIAQTNNYLISEETAFLYSVLLCTNERMDELTFQKLVLNQLSKHSENGCHFRFCLWKR